MISKGKAHRRDAEAQRKAFFVFLRVSAVKIHYFTSATNPP